MSKLFLSDITLLPNSFSVSFLALPATLPPLFATFLFLSKVSNMDDLELIFTMLGERVTTEISKKEKPDTFDKNKNVAKRGGKVAGNARKDTEKELGRSVISDKNSLDINDELKLKE
jgi:hypothetical protein